VPDRGQLPSGTAKSPAPHGPKAGTDRRVESHATPKTTAFNRGEALSGKAARTWKMHVDAESQAMETSAAPQSVSPDGSQ